MADRKIVVGVHAHGSKHWVGDGFPVRNVFPSSGVSEEMNPFILLDYMGPAHVPPSDHQRGVGEHPHRGFETVTLVYQGKLAHRDSSGNSGMIGPGDVQWMTAASGVVHEELHEREFAKMGGTVEGIQLWVNLPKAHKMSQPGYQGLRKDQIPEVKLAPGASARVIAGALEGATGPARTFTPMNVLDVHLRSGSRADLHLPEGHNTGIVLRKGDIEINGSTPLKGEAMLVVLSAPGSLVSLEAREDSDLVVLTGEPIPEPVVQHGPFVMNTEEEIRQAFLDYKGGRMGRLT
ncbi:MAG: pirin family protein [Bryobacteraceae bacterium]